MSQHNSQIDNCVIQIVNIVICYNNANEVSEYADRFFELRFSEKAFLIIVVNSVQKEDINILQRIKSKYSNIKICDPKQNLGYMNGLLYGYKQYSLISSVVPKYVIMSNTDIEYEGTDFLDKLLEKKYPLDVWCIGPSIYTKFTSNYDNPVADKRRSKAEINSLIRRFSIPGFNVLYVMLSNIKAKLKISRKTASKYVYEVHGCYFILTGQCAEEIKEDSYGALMYSEETYIAEQVIRHGKREYYDADLEVVHFEHATTKLLGSAKIAKNLSHSMKYIRNRFYD